MIYHDSSRHEYRIVKIFDHGLHRHFVERHLLGAVGTEYYFVTDSCLCASELQLRQTFCYDNGSVIIHGSCFSCLDLSRKHVEEFFVNKKDNILIHVFLINNEDVTVLVECFLLDLRYFIKVVIYV